jgi:hypothetical protein
MDSSYLMKSGLIALLEDVALAFPRHLLYIATLKNI